MSLITCSHLTKRYGKTTALNAIDLTLEKGRITGLLGPNGSGKTTFIKLANGLLKPEEGALEIDGHAPGVHTKQIVSYLPDKDVLPDWMRIRQLISFYRDFYQDFDQRKAEEMLTNLDLDREMVLKKLSKGNREKVQLILTMSRQSKVYLLDEPIAGVDPAARDYILRTIISNYAEDALVVISTHLIADVESILDEAVFLKNGEVVLHKGTDEIRSETGMSVDGYFREVFKC